MTYYVQVIDLARYGAPGHHVYVLPITFSFGLHPALK